MSTKENKIGLIVGGGNLPIILTQHLLEKDYSLYAVNISEKDLPIELKDCARINYTEVSKILEFFKYHKIQDLIFCGAIERPKDLSSLKTDFEGAKLLASILSRKILGDNNILLTVKKFLEARGFNLLSINEIMPSLVAKKGTLTKAEPKKEFIEDLKIATEFLNTIASFDVGQSIIIENKRIITIEAAEGTDNMIKRSKNLINHKALLVKIPKKNQIIEIDLPTIGPKTIENMVESNIAALAIKAGETIILESDKTVDLANRSNIAIFAF